MLIKEESSDLACNYNEVQNIPMRMSYLNQNDARRELAYFLPCKVCINRYGILLHGVATKTGTERMDSSNGLLRSHNEESKSGCIGTLCVHLAFLSQSDISSGSGHLNQ